MSGRSSRLDAFARLDDLGAVRRYTSKSRKEPRLAEEKDDAVVAFVIQVVGQKYYRAAEMVARSISMPAVSRAR
jgi:hypothetical protein